MHPVRLDDKSLDSTVLRKTERHTFFDDYDFLDQDEFAFSPFGSATIGIPEFYTQAAAEMIGKIGVGKFQYTPAHGSKQMKKTLVEIFGKYANLPKADPEKNIAVGLGDIALIRKWVQMLMKEQDQEGIMFEPYYPSHFLGFHFDGNSITSPMKFNDETGLFEIDFEDLEKRLNSKTRVIIFSNPCNPTSKVMTKEEYVQLSTLLDKYPEVKVIEDCAYCVYLDPTIKRQYFHEVGDNFKRTITVFSAGKLFNTTGNRLGFCFAHEDLMGPFKRAQEQDNFPGALDQVIYAEAFKRALEPYKGFPSFWEYISDDIRKRIAYAMDKLQKLGIICYPAQGSYYLTINCLELADKVSENYFMSIGPHPKLEPYRDRAVCRRLALEFKVGLMPYSGVCIINRKHFDRFVRIACNRSYEDLDIAIDAIKKVLESPNK